MENGYVLANKVDEKLNTASVIFESILEEEGVDFDSMDLKISEERKTEMLKFVRTVKSSLEIFLNHVNKIESKLLNTQEDFFERGNDE